MVKSFGFFGRWCLPAALLWVAAPALAQPERKVVWISTQGAFHAVAREGAWCQRVLLVENASETDRQVKVSCLADVAGRGKMHFDRVCQVPAQARRRVEIAVRPGQMRMISQPDPSKPLSGREFYEERFALADAIDGGHLSADGRPINRILPGRTAVGIIMGTTHEEENYGYLEQLADEPLGSVQQVGSSGQYATRWYGYALLDLLLLSDLNMGRVRSSQVDALLKWVRRGGVLVVAGAETYGETFQQELTEATGVTAVGVHYIGTMRVRGLGIDPNAIGLHVPLPMAELAVGDAEVVLTCNDLPLVTAHRLGLGTVYTVATPLAALRDARLHGLWSKVRQSMNTVPPVNGDDFVKPEDVRTEVRRLASELRNRAGDLPAAEEQKARSMAEVLSALAEPGAHTVKMLAGRRAPPRWMPVALLAAMAGTVAVAGLLLRVVRRGELLWLILVPAAAVLSTGLYSLGLSRSQPESLSFVGVVTSLGDGTVRVQEIHQYYAGPEPRKLTFAAGSADGIIRDIGEVGSAALEMAETRTSREISLPEVAVQTNGTAAFYLDAVTATAGLKPDLTFGPDGLTGVIRNELGFPLDSAVVYCGGRTYRLGTIDKGEQKVSVGRGDRLGRVDYENLQAGLSTLLSAGPLRPPPPAGRPAAGPEAPATQHVSLRRATGEFTGAMVRTVTDAHRNRLVSLLASIPAPSRTVQDAPVLIAYGSRGLLDPLGGRLVGRQGWNVVVWPLEFRAPPSGTAVNIPSGLLQLQFPPRGAPVYDPRTGFNTIRAGAGLLIHATPPAVIGPLREARARLRLSVQAKDYRMGVYGLPPDAPSSSDGELIVQRDRPMGIVDVEVPQAERFRTAGGAYAFWIRFGDLKAQADEAAADNTFEGVDVDLEGITP